VKKVRPLSCNIIEHDPEERERMYEICAKLQVEQDHNTFTRLMTELNSLLERKEQRLQERGKQKLSDC